MPLFFQQDIDADTRLAVWKIKEEESFFQVPLQRDIGHPHKRLQHLAGRYLLGLVFPEFPLQLIEIADTRKPFLKEEDFHFSISHCGDYAAVIVSRTKRVGIDVEMMSEKINRIRGKFISDKDHAVFLNDDLFTGTLAWSCKEAIFKWWGAGGVDFREHIRLGNIQNRGDDIFRINATFSLLPVHLCVDSVLFRDLCLSWVVS